MEEEAGEADDGEEEHREEEDREREDGREDGREDETADGSRPAVSVNGLVKVSGEVKAVDGVSFEIERGEVFALLGPNGAGKSTTVEILEGHRIRTSGEVRVLDTDPQSSDAAFRDRIGVVLQTSGIDPELTVREAIEFYGLPYSRRRPTVEVLELVELEDKADARVNTLSGGQKRRIDLALGLVGDPEVIFLDEPTTGFDPAARRRGWELVERLASEDRTILLTTHYLDEAEHLADRVAVLAKGRIAAEGTPDELKARAGHTLIRFAMPDIDQPVAGLLRAVSGNITGRGRHVEIATLAPTADLAHLTAWAVENDIELADLAVSRPSLEDVYLKLLEDNHDPSIHNPTDHDPSTSEPGAASAKTLHTVNATEISNQ